jgi:hypothetical protein
MDFTAVGYHYGPFPGHVWLQAVEEWGSAAEDRVQLIQRLLKNTGLVILFLELNT